MTEFVKPLLTEDAPEPPLLEPQKQEEAHQRARQSLAGQQGATQMAEAAGLTQKPVVPVVKSPETKKKMQGPAKPKIAAKPKPKSKSKPKAKKAPTIKKKQAAPHKKAEAKEPATSVPPPVADLDKSLRQEALIEAIAAMQSGPDEDTFAGLFELYGKAPDKETVAAATVLTATFLRTSAKARGPLLKALTPAMRTWRNAKLVILLAAKLGKVIVAKPPAPPPAPPPGG